MEFTKTSKEVKMLAPPDFKSEIQKIEYRNDPLTGSTCIINVKRAERVRQAQKATKVSDTITIGTREGCFFCPENISEATPKFPAEICAAGRIERGECTVFPNLFAFAEYHAVGTFSEAHFLDLDQFTHEMITDNILACREWMLSVYTADKKAEYPIYMWNHLPPSGGSIVHPHVQILMRERPTSMQALLLAKSKDYFQSTGQNYWEELIEKEKGVGERYIAENETLALVASYAPRGFREIQFVFKSASSFVDLNDGAIEDFAEVLVKVLRSYKEMGVGSFNLITFSGPAGGKPDHYSLNAKIIPRPFPQGVYTNDTGTFERLQDEWVIETLPEDVAKIMRVFFTS